MQLEPEAQTKAAVAVAAGITAVAATPDPYRILVILICLQTLIVVGTLLWVRWSNQRIVHMEVARIQQLLDNRAPAAPDAAADGP